MSDDIHLEVSSQYLLPNLDDFQICEDQSIFDSSSNHKIGVIKATGQKVSIEYPSNNKIDNLENLIKEYNISCQCSHPNLQMPVGFFQSSNPKENCYITIFQENGTLDKFLISHSKKITNGNKYCLAYGIAKGIKYLHDKDIMHYKLIPKNILIDHEFHPIIKKYGINQKNSVTDSTLNNYIAYLSPEIIKGHVYEKLSDIYSYGLLLYEIFSHKQLYEGLSIQEIIQQKSESSYGSDKKIPNCINQLIKQCTEPDPTKRPTISEICEKLESNFFQITDETMASQYTTKLKVEEQIKRTFKIPKQMLKLPTENQPWNLASEDPIDYFILKELFCSQKNKKIILINVFGEHESGKSTLLRTLTGNQAYYSGTGMHTTTLGVLIDGPYNPQDIIDNIFDEDYKLMFNDLNINNNNLIYFMDTQGIGDRIYENQYKVVLERIHSILCAFSTICINITKCAISQQNLFDLFKILRRGHFLNNGSYTKLLMLIKDYDGFENIGNYDFENLDEFQKDFVKEYWISNSEASKYYLKNDLIPIPFGNCKNNYKKYVYSIWYSFYHCMKNIDEEKLIDIRDFLQTLPFLNSYLFGQTYKYLYREIMTQDSQTCQLFDNNKETNTILKTLTNCCHYLACYALSILSIYSTSHFSDEVNDAINSIKTEMDKMKSFYLPYFLGEFNIPLDEYEQYSSEIIKDINSYLKSQSNIWKSHMSEERRLRIEKKDVGSIIPLYFIPIYQWGYMIYTAVKTKQIQKRIDELEKLRKHVRNSFKPTFYPFFWQNNLTKIESCDFSIPSLAKSENRLLVFYEQENNESTNIFRAITMIDVSFQQSKNVFLLFKNVNCQKLLYKFKRYGKLNQHEYPQENVNVVYLKGIHAEQNIINDICYLKKSNIVFITTIKEGQKLKVKPNFQMKEKFKFYVFYLSQRCFKNPCATKSTFISNKISLEQNKEQFNMKYGEILPIKTSDFGIEDSMPVANSLLKQSARYIINGKLDLKS